MLSIHQLLYTLPNNKTLFKSISLNLHSREKAALIGKNGEGKSTLFRLISGELSPTQGTISNSFKTFMVRQINDNPSLTVAGALGVEDKILALRRILEGNPQDSDFETLDDDWEIEDRCEKALRHFGSGNLDLLRPLSSFSGGEQMRIQLAGSKISETELLLLDEPGNHLDAEGYEVLTKMIKETSCAILMVSHDEELLSLFDRIIELEAGELSVYQGGYEFYKTEKNNQQKALKEDIQSREKEIKKAEKNARKTLERQLKRSSHGKKSEEKAGMPKIVLNMLRDQSEKSLNRLKEVHEHKKENLQNDLETLRNKQKSTDKMKLLLEDSLLHNGKVLAIFEKVNHVYQKESLWKTPLDIEIRSGERIHLQGKNGSGKSTFLRLLTGEMEPTEGRIKRLFRQVIDIDQHYSLLNQSLTVSEMAASFNDQSMAVHELNTLLSRFLFEQRDWDKKCGSLSGGERMRLLLCCMSIRKTAPDMVILDEPGNNLDIESKDILCQAFSEYKGTLLLVTHDKQMPLLMKTERSVFL